MKLNRNKSDGNNNKKEGKKKKLPQRIRSCTDTITLIPQIRHYFGLVNTPVMGHKIE